MEEKLKEKKKKKQKKKMKKDTVFFFPNSLKIFIKYS